VVAAVIAIVTSCATVTGANRANAAPPDDKTFDYMNIVGLGGEPVELDITTPEFRNLLDYMNVVGLGGEPVAIDINTAEFRELLDYLNVVGLGG
jgi:hypothetical protein